MWLQLEFFGGRDVKFYFKKRMVETEYGAGPCL